MMGHIDSANLKPSNEALVIIVPTLNFPGKKNTNFFLYILLLL